MTQRPPVRSEVTWPTIPAMVRDAARRFGDTDAVVDGARRIGFAELGGAVTDAARALVHCGVRTGDRVAVWAPNSVEWIVAALGVTTAGAVLVPVNTRFRGAEAAFILSRSNARVLFTVRGFLDTDYPALLADVGCRAAGARAHRAAGPVSPTAPSSAGMRSWSAGTRCRPAMSTHASRRSGPTTRATSCTRRAPPATRRAS